MINSKSLAALYSARFGPGFIRPLYENYSFANIPATVRKLFGLTVAQDTALLPADCLPGKENGQGQAYKHIIFVLIDGFGWDKLLTGTVGTAAAQAGQEICSLDHEAWPGLELFERYGVVSSITSQFPSTTVVHSVTMASGHAPGRAGVIEWFYHEPRIGRVITPFLLNYAGERTYGTLKAAGFGCADIFPKGHFLDTLRQNGIRPYVYASEAFTPSDFSARMQSAATVVPTSSPATAFWQLRDRLGRDERAWHFVYLESYDHLEHKLGASSAEARSEARMFFSLLRDFLVTPNGTGQPGRQDFPGLPPETLLLVSADHGQVDQFPERAIYVNKLWPELAGHLRTGTDGAPLAAAGGSGRTLNLHLKPDRATLVRDKLRELLSGQAEVLTHEDLLELGVYGPPPHCADLRERAGDLVILAHRDQAVWWYEPNRFFVKNKGNHGGLTRDEIEIPLLALRS